MIYISAKLGLAPALTTRFDMPMLRAEDFLSTEGKMRKNSIVYKPYI